MSLLWKDRFEMFQIIDSFDGNHPEQCGEAILALINKLKYIRLFVFIKQVKTIVNLDPSKSDRLLPLVSYVFSSPKCQYKRFSTKWFSFFFLVEGFSRPFCAFMGKLISTNCFSQEYSCNLIFKTIMYLTVGYPSFESAICASSFVINIKSYMENYNLEYLKNAVSLVRNLFGHFHSPKSISCMKEFNQFIETNEIAPSWQYKALIDDNPSAFPEDFDANSTFCDSIFGFVNETYCSCTVFSAAAALGAKKCVKMFIDKQADPLKADFYGRNFASMCGIRGDIEMFLSIAPNQQHFIDYIHYAIKYRKENSITKLIDNNNSITKETLLHICCTHNNFTYMSKLLLQGANASALNDFDDHPLHTAARNGSTECIHILCFQYGVNSRTSNCLGFSPLLLSVKYSYIETCVSIEREIANDEPDQTSPEHNVLSYDSSKMSNEIQKVFYILKNSLIKDREIYRD